MAQEDIIRRLLIKLGISTKDFEAGIGVIKARLDALYADEKKKAEERKTASAQSQADIQKETVLAKEAAAQAQKRVESLKLESVVNKQLLMDQTRLIAQERADMDVRLASYRMLEAEGKISKVTLDTLERQLATERSQLLVREAIVRASLTGKGGIVPTGRSTAAAVASSRDTAGVAQIQSKLQAAVSATTPAAVTGEQLAQERMVIAELKTQLGLQEQILKSYSASGTVNKADAQIVQSKINSQKQYLLQLEREYAVHEQVYRRLQSETQEKEKQSKIRAATASPAGIAQITSTAAQATKVSALTAAQVTERQRELDIALRELAVEQRTVQVLLQKGAANKADADVVLSRIAEKRSELALEQEQLRLQRAKSGGEGLFSGIAEKLRDTLKEVTGGGLLGNIAGGAFIGTMGAEVFTGMIQQIHELGQALLEASGRAQNLRIVFERLAERRGGAGPEELLNKFREASHGMVADTELFNIATRLMRQNINVTEDQMVKLVGTTIDLARASGTSVPLALNALTRAAQGTRMQALALATGLSLSDFRMQQLPATMDKATRQTLQYNETLNAMTRALAKLGGAPATTLPDLFRQIETAQKNFVDSIAEGVVSNVEFGATIQSVSKSLAALMPKIMEIGKTIGKDLVEAGKWVIANWGTIKTIFEGLILLKVADWGIGILTMIVDWKKELLGLGELLKDVITKLGVIQGIKKLGGVLGAPTGVVPTVERGAEQGLAQGAGQGVAQGVAGGWMANAMRGVLPFIIANAGVIAGVVSVVAGILGIELVAHQAKEQRDAERYKRQMENVTRYGSSEGPYKPGRRAAVEEGVGISESAAKGFDFLTHMQDLLAKQAPQLPDISEETIAVEKQLAALQLKIDESRLKAKYAMLKDNLDEEAALQKMYYITGQSDFETYMAQQKDMRLRQHNLTMEQLDKEKQFALDKIDRENQALINANKATDNMLRAQQNQPGVTPEQMADLAQQRGALLTQNAELTNKRVLAKQKEAVDDEFDAKKKEAQTKYDTQEITANEQKLTSYKRAYESLEAELTRIQKEGVDNRLKALDEEFANGLISANNYLAQRKLLIAQERAAAIQAAQEQYAASEKGPMDEVTRVKETVQAEITYQRQLTELMSKEDKYRLEGTMNTYKRITEFYTAQRDISAARGDPGDLNIQVAAQRQLIAENLQYQANLKSDFELTKTGSEQWFKIQQEIGKATVEAKKLNLEMAKLTDAFGAIGNLFQTISGQLYRTTGGIGYWVKQMGDIMKLMSAFHQAAGEAGGGKAMLGDLGTSFKGLFSRKPSTLEKPPVAETPQQQLGNTTKEIVAQLRAMMDGLKNKFANELSAQAQTVSTQLAAMGNQAQAAGQALANIATGGKGGAPTGGVTGTAAAGTGGFWSMLGGAPGVGEAPGGVAGPPDVSGLGVAPSMESAMGKSAASLTPSLDSLAQSADQASKAQGGLGAKFKDFAGNLGNWVGAIAGVVKGITGGQTTAGGAMSGGMAGLSFGAQFGPWGAAIGGIGGLIGGAFFGAKNERIQEMATEFKNRMKGIEDALNAGTMSLGSAVQNLQTERSQILTEMSGGKKKENAQLKPILDAITQEIQGLQLQMMKTLNDMHAQIAILSSPTAFQPFMDSLDQIIQKYQQFASAAQGNAVEMANANNYLTLSLKAYVTTLSEQLNQAQQTAVSDALHLLDIQQQQLALDSEHQQNVYDTLTQGVLTRQRTDAMTRGAQIEQLNRQYSLQKDQLNQEQALTQFKVDAESKIFSLATDRISLEAQLLGLQEAAYGKNVAQVEALQQTVTALQNALSTGTLPAGLYSTTGPIDLQAIEQLLGIPVTNVPGNTLLETNYGGAGNIYAPGTNVFPPGVQTAPPANATPPHYQMGGFVPTTGPAVLHEGEYVLTAEQTKKVAPILVTLTGATLGPFAGLMPKGGPVPKSPVRTGPDQWRLPTHQTGVTSAMEGAVAANTLKVHQQVYDLASTRIGMEQDLLRAQQQQTAYDMARIAQLSSLMDKMATVGGVGDNVMSLEGGLAKIYELRGRYGSGSFRREQL